MEDAVEMLDVVALTVDLPARGLRVGDEGTILEILPHPEGIGYLVEFADGDGCTIADPILGREQFRLVWSAKDAHRCGRRTLKVVEKGSDLILFLDFDGPMHPLGAAQWVPVDGYLTVTGDALFRHLPRLEAVLREHPRIDVVIMSTWRRRYSLDELRDWFSPDLRGRVVGMVGVKPASRQELAEDYMRTHAPGRAWLALDDETREFAPDCRQLIACDAVRGFDEDAEMRLRQAIREAQIHEDRGMAKATDPGIEELDVVELNCDLPEQGLKAGDLGTIVHMVQQPGTQQFSYLVEFDDADGDTIAIVSLDAAALRRVWSARDERWLD